MTAKLTTEEFKKRSVLQHNNRYDYSQVEYLGRTKDVKIICSEHGEFYQTANNHLTGSGCPSCAGLKRLTTAEFVIRATKAHGDKYDYSAVEYHNNSTPVTIICKEHGAFKQKPNSHLSRCGCPSCSLVPKIDITEFILRSKAVHGDKYNYVGAVYKNQYSRVKVVCEQHGEFLQIAYNHMTGQGCPKCGIEKRKKSRSMKLDEFMVKAEKVHGSRYCYDKVKFDNTTNKITIVCSVHGEFLQVVNNHLQGQNCPNCVANAKYGKDEFVNRVTAVHSGKYQYSKTNFTKLQNKILITCPKHGDFYQRAGDHLHSKNGCPKCAISQSKAETEVFNFIQSLGFKPEERNRKIIKPYELDIVIPEKLTAIEYNGLRFHSDLFENARSRHKQKSTQCQAAGYKLIHIYEDDWLTRPEVVKKTLKHILGVSDERLYARKLTVQVLPAKATKPFYTANHMQGSGRGDSWCLMNDDQIVAAMQFGISSSERGNKDNSRYELIRFATSCQVVGGASKLFKTFIRDNPDVQTIVSYSDNDMFTGQMYEVLGFLNAGQTPPDYKVIVGQQRYHKANFKKSSIKKNYPEAYDETLTEKEMCHKLGFYRIYNTGLTKWIWTKCST